SSKPLTLLHFSSDYVYSGAGDMPWREDDAPAPINAYGRAKAAGDQALLSALAASPHTVAAMASRLYILRTSWVYHSHGQNFINTMLRLAAERDVLRVVDDQCGAPTPASWAASISGLLLQSQAASGLYHLAPSGVTSWYGVAYAALSSAVSAGLIRQVPELVAISSSDYATPAKRPCNSRLDCQKLQQALGIEFADWQRLLRQHITQLA
ncbi:MAG TPA: NAD(P)-dependent oxidoreductase, partial [Rheinheimera sp.]|nr:NAD(P)-dependent oxidoreductase [Rheinheimera sp.]